MKNKTIEILDAGTHTLPIGTKITTVGKDKAGHFSDLEIELKDYKIDSENNNSCGYHVQVDFSDLPPLYPTKGMEVPEEGIEFACGRCVLLGVSNYGISYRYNNGICDINTWKTVELKESSTFELKRTLPKTITVCAGGCFKEVCECGRAEGWYRVNYGGRWQVRYWDGSVFRFFEEGADIGLWRENYTGIDWSNPINVIPEGESTNETN